MKRTTVSRHQSSRGNYFVNLGIGTNFCNLYDYYNTTHTCDFLSLFFVKIQKKKKKKKKKNYELYLSTIILESIQFET
jgi:hypothetical protein